MKKFFSILGIIVGIALVVMGIVCLAGGLSGRVRTPETASRSGYGIYNYKNGYANFGTDFYSYVNNNTAEAADAAQTTAENLIDIHELLKNGFGLMMLFAGLISICGFGIKFNSVVEQNRKELIKAYGERSDQKSMRTKTENEGSVGYARKICTKCGQELHFMKDSLDEGEPLECPYCGKELSADN